MDDIPTPVPDNVPQPWARLLSLSAGVGHVELMANGLEDNGMISKYTFGRSKKKCDFVLDDQRVSSSHCFIYMQNITIGGSVASIVCINDESANGTYVNGERIKRGVKHVLHDGDELSLVKPEAQGPMSKWDQARFIVKLPAPARTTDMQMSLNICVGGIGGMGGLDMTSAGAGANSSAIRKRLGTISRLLQEDRSLRDHYQILRAIGEGAHGQVSLQLC
jgi:hypothetical protein